jgi:lipopolysaccharide biosynthesis glycosyltransferase/glycosyltransferase involved in cell wall biosynthesis
MPLVSIIMPVYNTEEYVATTLDALLAQTHTHIEILCINDGSKDSSGKILEDYATRDKRIKYFSQENSGPARARNVGLDNATGQYIMFCDSDDRYEHNMVAEMVAAIKDLDVVMCNSHNENQHYAFPFPEGEYAVNTAVRSHVNVYLWNKLFRKDIIDQYGVRFPDGLKADDNLFIYQYFACAKTIGCIDQKLYHYTIRDNSIMREYYSNNVKLRDVLDKIDIMGLLYDFIIQNNLWEDNAESYLNIFATEILYTWASVGDAWIPTFFEHTIKATAKSKPYFTNLGMVKLLSYIHDGHHQSAATLLDNLCSERSYIKPRRRYLGQELPQPIREQNCIPIIFSSDSAFVPYLSTAIASVIASASPTHHYDIIVLHEDILDEQRELLLTQVETTPHITLRFYHVGGLMLGNKCQELVTLDYIKIAAYYRLFIPEIFKHYDKVIYLDCDIAVKSDLAKLYHTDLQGKAIGAVIDYYVSIRTPEDEGVFQGLCAYAKNTLKLESLSRYFNSGVMLIDVQALITKNYSDDFIRMAKINNRFFHDQNVLNAVLQNDVHLLDAGWNFQCSGGQLPSHEMPLSDIHIVHYCSKKKPWTSPTIRLKNYFWTHARNTPFYEDIFLRYILNMRTGQ